ncbi:MAG: PDDEXK nuclease domain-containing protein [Bacteroidota bacterium]|nr:PDDEXK nuclease domain-containing protein [Bacteroidota bacterium]
MPFIKATYNQFVSDIKSRIKEAQYNALKKVNKELIALYWDIGKMIVEKQKEYGWGKSVVENLSKDLQNEFQGMSGYSSRNLWLMQQFYSSYIDYPKLQPLVAEISWSHNILIFSKCHDHLEREFYIRSIIKHGWSKNVLKHQIEGNAYQSLMSGQSNFNDKLPEKYRDQAILAIKDNYQFDFLEYSDKHSEYELEQEIIKNIRSFLLEMGHEFSFIGNQHRIEIDEHEYFIDLLLFHRKLQSLVAIELKTGQFKPEYAGKMQFYLSVLNDNYKMSNENDAIGIIVCKEKNRTIVEYALKNSKLAMGVATYSMHNELPKYYQDMLPSPDEIAEKLKMI